MTDMDNRTKPHGTSPKGPRATVIVTRPQAEADAWVQRLGQAGWPAVALPLLDIQAAGDPVQLRAAWRQLAAYRALMFVSAAAVQQFFAGRGDDGLWPQGLRAWCTGPGTRAVLLAAGVSADSIDLPAADAEQLDSESLWAVVQTQISPGDRVLLVRGQDADGEVAGRTWLAERLLEAGADVQSLAVYRRGLPVWTPSMLDTARHSLNSGSIWLFSSSQAVGHLPLLLGPVAPAASVLAVATHPRIAEAARQQGFARVDLCRPGLSGVLAFLESLA